MENKNLTEKPVEKKNKKEKIKKIKNQLLLRRGGFSLLITALFLAAVIVFNILVGALSERFKLEYDLSADGLSTVTEENVDYIESIETPVTITVCAGESSYVNYMSSIAPQMYYLMDDYSDYYKQTIRFINKYPEYNDKITVKYVDMYSDAAYAQIHQKYSSDNLSYGDIIVSAVIDNEGAETERHKVLTFNTIYNMVQDSSSYYSSISGNNIESALSNAIEYVLGVDKKALLLTGHSADSTKTLFSAYEKLLTSNNFDVESMDGLAINEIPETCDVVVIIQPNIDFQASELDVLNTFLENGGKLGKTLIYIGGTAAQNTPNLNEFLSDWGIVVREGILFETSGQYCVSGQPTSLYMSTTYGGIVSTENVPITIGSPVDLNTKAETFLSSPDTIVEAPIGSSADWNDYSSSDCGTYSLIAYSTKSGYTDSGDEVSSAVFAFSSADFVSPKMDGLLNTQFLLIANDYFVENGVEEIEFDSKTITSKTFTPVESTASTIQWIFVVLVPVAMLILAIVIYIRRKNAK